MAARYATDTFSVQLATGSHLVVEGLFYFLQSYPKGPGE